MSGINTTTVAFALFLIGAMQLGFGLTAVDEGEARMCRRLGALLLAVSLVACCSGVRFSP